MELSSSVEEDPCPNLWTRQPSLHARNPARKYNLHHQLLARAAKFRGNAGEKMAHQLERYKKL
jgi:hypothetical protein